MKRILVACEYSGRVRDAFAARGWDAWSCDFEPTESVGQHYQGDVRDLLGERWDMMVAHPPCTFLCNSGVRWLKTDPSRWAKMEDGCRLFMQLWNCGIPRVCIENPVMHGHARTIIGFGPTQTVQPWMFGHGECKRTCFWLRGLPPLVATEIVPGREQRIWRMPPSKDRWKERSKTYPGIAAAMAEQWSNPPDNFSLV